MNLKNILVIFFASFGMMLFSQTKPTDWEKNRLLGEVKFITQTTYELNSESEIQNIRTELYNKKGNLLKYTYKAGSIHSENTCHYDEKGNKMECKINNISDKYAYDNHNREIDYQYIVNGKVERRRTAKYNEKGTLENEFYYKNDTLSHKNEYFYTENGAFWKKITSDANGNMISWEEKTPISKRKIKITKTWADGDFETFIILYRKYKKIQRQYKNGVFQEKIITKWNKNNTFYQTKLSLSTGYKGKSTYWYDEKGNPIMIKIDKARSDKFKYTFDNQGNWIKRVEISRNKDFEITKREIEYHP